MTTVHLTSDILNAEHRAAIERLDDDLLAIMNDADDVHDFENNLTSLRGHVIAAYHDALANAAGHPFDAPWQTLAQAVAAFVARAAVRPSLHDAQDAARRLLLLAAETVDVREAKPLDQYYIAR